MKLGTRPRVLFLGIHKSDLVYSAVVLLQGKETFEAVREMTGVSHRL